MCMDNCLKYFLFIIIIIYCNNKHNIKSHITAPKFSKLLWLDSNANQPTNKVGIYRMSYDGTEVEKIAHQHHYISSLSLDTHVSDGYEDSLVCKCILL